MKGGEDMEAPKMQVKCSVENCHYNRNYICNAHALEVSALGDGRADTREGTCCDTFLNRT